MTTDDRLTDLLDRWQLLLQAGRDVPAAQLCADCPGLAPELERRAEAVRRMNRLVVPAAGDAGHTSPGGGTAAQPWQTDSAAGGGDTPASTVGAAGAPAGEPRDLHRLGGYRLLELVGQGGMGAVYRAEDLRLGRTVAVKVMKPATAADPQAEQRFLREARAAAALQHDHVVPIFHVGEEGGVPFIVMPLLAGESLEARLQRESRLSAAEVARIGREAAEGLAAAHATGLVHRDIKPANLWLEASTGRVKVLDFGLARAAAVADGLTQSGAVPGTPGYMAPEQIDGRPADARSDLFGLGCVLYRAATGGPPFQARTLTGLLRAVAEHHPPPPREVRPELPAALSDLIVQLLAKDPEQRPPSARTVADALAAGAPPTAAGPKQAARRLSRRTALGAAAGLLAAGGAVAAWLARPASPGGARPGTPATPLKGVLDVRVWPKGQSDLPGGRRLTAEVLPLKPGDLLRIEATLNRPAYLYLVWLDADGTATPLWPWLDNDWRRRSADRDRPLQAVSLPPEAGRGTELQPDRSGIQSLLLLARDEPLPAGEDLANRFAGLPKQGGLDPLRTRLAAWFENGEPVRDEPDRAPINLSNTQAIEDPVWRMRLLLRGDLRPLFPYTRAVCFTFQGH
jgi:hypothetical protein